MNPSLRSTGPVFDPPTPATPATAPPARRVRAGRAVVAGLVLAGAALAVGVARRSAAPPDDFPSIRAAVDARQFDRAEAALLGRLRRSDRDDVAWVMLGGVRALAGREREAEAAYERVTAAGPARTQARTQLAEIALRRHDRARAEAILRDLVATDPRATDARRRLAGLLTTTARDDEARIVLRELLELDPSTRHLLTLTGLGAPETASRNENDGFEEFLRATPDDPILRRARGLSLHRAGRLLDARADLEAAARALTDDPIGRLALADARLAARDLDGVAPALGEEPAGDGRLRARWWLVRSQLAEARGDLPEALAHARAALAAAPDDRGALYRVGQLLVRDGRGNEAAPLLARSEAIRARDLNLVLELDRCVRGGVDAGLYEHIADLCRETGLAFEARRWYEEAVRLDPTRASAQASLGRLGPPATAPPPAPGSIGPHLRPDPLAEPTRVADRATTGGPVHLVDVADRAGLAYRYDAHPSGNLYLGDTMGGGVGMIDYDEDGFLDVYFVGGCPLPIPPGQDPAPNRLYRNRGDGTFEDVTARAGVAGHGYGMGCSVADYDNDGHDDLYVTGLGRSTLYRNRGDGTFEDATARAKVGTDRWSTASGFADLDADGDLDLFVVTYVQADPANVPQCFDPTGRPFHCPPGQFPAEFDLLFRNDGDGTFTDVSRAAGLEVKGGLGLGLALADFDEDGKLDCFVANDAAPNFLFRNLGGLNFEEVGVASGMAYDGSGRATASMGVVAEDLDGDDRMDLLHVNFLNEASTLLRNLGGGLFDDITSAAGLDTNGRTTTGFGALAFDLENDGQLDLFVANGHVDDRPWANHPMAQRPNLFRSRGPGRYALAPPDAAPYLGRPLVGRGAAAGDLDNDGRTDLVVVHRDAPAALLHNATPDAGHWLTLRLIGGDRSGRTPVGARVTVQAGGRTTTRWLVTGTSYLAAHDLRLGFGLGDRATVDRLEVRWPSGTTQSWTDLAADRFLALTEGHEPIADPRVAARR